MRVLLDTHAFLWWVNDDERLPRRARRVVTGASEAFVSMASCWELAIKVSLDKLQLPKPVDRFIPEQLAGNDFKLLHIDLPDVARVERLPFHHRDPFDRLLAAQALNDDLAIVTRDPAFSKYGLRRVW